MTNLVHTGTLGSCTFTVGLFVFVVYIYGAAQGVRPARYGITCINSHSRQNLTVAYLVTIDFRNALVLNTVRNHLEACKHVLDVHLC